MPYQVWPNFLGEKISKNEHFITSKDLMNLGSSGAGNYEIYSRTVDAISSQKNIGLVVVMWSEFPRVDFEVDLRNFKADKETTKNKFGYMSYIRLYKGKTRYPVYFENWHPEKVLTIERKGIITIDNKGKKVVIPSWKYKLSELFDLKKINNNYSGINAFIRYAYSIQAICDNENIPLIQIMGTRPVVNDGVWPDVTDTTESAHLNSAWQECCSIMIRHPMLEKIKNNFIGWPVFKELGGFNVDDLIEQNDIKWVGKRGNLWPADLRISENDSHPNLKGHKFIGEYLYEQYEKLYPDS
jgi:lysophospholipase L1-like esterase